MQTQQLAQMEVPKMRKHKEALQDADAAIGADGSAERQNGSNRLPAERKQCCYMILKL